MNKCKTCKHKKVTHGEFFECDKIPFGKDLEDDILQEKKAQGEEIYAHYLTTDDTSVFTQDGSGYFACLRIPDDFGCVLWEGKDE